MRAELRGSAAAGIHGTLDDALAFARELQSPTLVAPETLAEATSVQFAGLGGVLPDVGRFDPNDWGLGVELRDGEAAALDRARATRSARSATSAAAGRSSGSIPRRASRAPA